MDTVVPEPVGVRVPLEGLILTPLTEVDEDQFRLPCEPEASANVCVHVQLPSLFCGQFVSVGLIVICGAAHVHVALCVLPPETRKSRLAVVGQGVSGIVIVTVAF